LEFAIADSCSFLLYQETPVHSPDVHGQLRLQIFATSFQTRVRTCPFWSERHDLSPQFSSGLRLGPPGSIASGPRYRGSNPCLPANSIPGSAPHTTPRFTALRPREHPCRDENAKFSAHSGFSTDFTQEIRQLSAQLGRSAIGECHFIAHVDVRRHGDLTRRTRTTSVTIS